jgi:hypothetical protein
MGYIPAVVTPFKYLTVLGYIKRQQSTRFAPRIIPLPSRSASGEDREMVELHLESNLAALQFTFFVASLIN